jgi:hypothetical protein
MNSQSKHKHVGPTARIRSPEEPSLAQLEERGGAVRVVQATVAGHGIRFPIGLDNAYATWNSYGVELRPTLFVLDRRGAIAHRRVGEDGYAQTERVIKRLLAEPAPGVLDAAACGSPARWVA